MSVAQTARDQWVRPIAFGLAAAVLLLVALSATAAYQVVLTDPRVRFGIDLEIMLELGRRWLETGSMYLPYQLAGPYSIDVTPTLDETPALYPPAAGPVFGLLNLIPRALVFVGWWLIPIGIVMATIVRWRPAPWTWPLMAACFVHPMGPLQLMVGGTAIWITALTALGLTHRWPAAFILLKPTMLPFALLGARDRRWWLAVGILAGITVVGPWQEYLSVVSNASDSGGGVLYSLKTFPMTALPLFAWLGRTTDVSSR